MQQVVFIHGGDARENYKDFDEYLEKMEYCPIKEKKVKWKMTLQEKLGDNFDVMQPAMPNKDFANYDEWRIVFEKVIPYLQDDIILIGHSMWGTFLLKYLNENTLRIKIKNIFLVAPAFENIQGEVLWSFLFDAKLLEFQKHQDITFVYHSQDDPVVPFLHFELLIDKLPKIIKHSFSDRGHFVDPDFPEIITDIQNTYE